MQPFKTHHVTDGTIRSFTAVTGLHISCILCFFLMLTSHFCFLSVPSVYSSFVLYIRVSVGPFCVCVPAVFVCNTLDAFAPSPGDGPAAVAAGPAADAFGGSGGWQNSFLCKCVCGCMDACACVCVWTWKLLLLLLYYKAASASIGDSRTNMCPQGLLSLPKSCSNAPVMDPLLLHLDNSSLPNIHPVNTTVKSTILLLTIL